MWGPDRFFKKKSNYICLLFFIIPKTTTTHKLLPVTKWAFHQKDSHIKLVIYSLYCILNGALEGVIG